VKAFKCNSVAFQFVQNTRKCHCRVIFAPWIIL